VFFSCTHDPSDILRLPFPQTKSKQKFNATCQQFCYPVCLQRAGHEKLVGGRNRFRSTAPFVARIAYQAAMAVAEAKELIKVALEGNLMIFDQLLETQFPTTKCRLKSFYLWQGLQRADGFNPRFPSPVDQNNIWYLLPVHKFQVLSLVVLLCATNVVVCKTRMFLHDKCGEITP